MALNIFPLKKFTGMSCASDPTDTTHGLAYDIRDIVFSPKYAISTRPGFLKWNTTSVGTAITSIFYFKGRTTTKTIVCSSGWVIADSETIKSGNYSDVRYTFAVLNGTLFFTNGYDLLSAYDGSQCDNMGIYSPYEYGGAGDLPPTFNARISGNLEENSEYYFAYTYWNDNRGIESDPSLFSEVMTTGTSAANEDGLRINIPANSSVDSQVTHVKIYRSTAGNGILYYDGMIDYDGTATTYDSTKADAELGNVMGELNSAQSANVNVRGVPPRCPYMVANKGRIFLWGTRKYSEGDVDVTNGSKTVTASTGSNTNWHSGLDAMYFQIDGDSRRYRIANINSPTELDLTEDYQGDTATNKSYTIYLESGILYYSYINLDGYSEPESFPAHYWLAVDKENNDEGTGIAVVHNQVLVAKKSALYILSGNVPEEFRITPLSSTVGCISHYSMVNDDDGNVIFASEKGVYITDGNEVRNMSNDTIQNIFTGENNPPWKVDQSALHTCHAVYDSINKLYILWVQSDGASAIDKALVFDFKKIDGVPAGWSWWNVEANCSGVIENNDGIPLVAFGDTYGFLKYFDSTATNDGAGSSGTRRGTVTSSTNNTLTDTTANFYTTASGLQGVWVKIISGTGKGQVRRIISNTSDTLTVDSDWDTNPDTTSIYAIGYIKSYYKTKWLDFGTLRDKLIRRLRVIFKSTSSDYSMYMKQYQNFSSTASQTKYFSVNEADGYHTTGLSPNRARYYQFEIGADDVDRPITVNNIDIEFRIRGETQAKKERANI